MNRNFVTLVLEESSEINEIIAGTTLCLDTSETSTSLSRRNQFIVLGTLQWEQV